MLTEIGEFLWEHKIYIAEIVLVMLMIVYLVCLGMTNAELAQYNEIENDVLRAFSIMEHDNYRPSAMLAIGVVELLALIGIAVGEIVYFRRMRDVESTTTLAKVTIISILANLVLIILVLVLLNNPILWAAGVVAMVSAGTVFIATK